MREKYLNAAGEHQRKGEIVAAISDYRLARENGADVESIEFLIEEIEKSKIAQPGYMPDKSLEKFIQDLNTIVVKPELKNTTHHVSRKGIAASFSSFLNQVNAALGLSSQEKTNLRDREKEMTEFTKDVEGSTPPSPKRKGSGPE